jgi:hypothetical protein
MNILTYNIVRRDTKEILMEIRLSSILSPPSPNLMWINTGESHYLVPGEIHLELINLLHFVNLC